MTLTIGAIQLSQFQENKIKVKRPSGGVDAATSVFAGLKHPRAESAATGGADGFADLKRQALAPVPLAVPTSLATPGAALTAAAIAAGAAPSAPRAGLEPAAESRDSVVNKLRARELELAEKRLELERLRFESEREERTAIVASMQANTSLLLRLVERLDQQATANANAMNGAGMGTFLGRQPL